MRHASHGIDAGHDTDEHMENVESKLEADADDPAIGSDPGGPYAQLTMNFEMRSMLHCAVDISAMQQVSNSLYFLYLTTFMLEIFPARTQTIPTLFRELASSWKVWHCNLR